ncbi:PepSY domain-containing protein [Sporosarcina sp. Sa3CUA8]|uniref:PepSY domain-containing protein n=2 Tax=Sporosarcina gallistercoris TaxID=2762245 RepID=A0ABR8PKN9_9BACL|nr:PepSY domain-containing protein [Sporosarcina gallistercoris]
MKSIVSHADTIPSDSIKNQLETMYNGKVNDLLLQNDIYGATLTREGSVYAVRVDSETGNVLSMVLEKPSTEMAAKQEEVPEKAEKKKDEEDSKDQSSVEKTVEVPAQPAAEATKPQPKTPKPAPVQPKPQPKPQQQQQQSQSQMKPPVSKPAPQKTVLLTEQQAIQIALRQLKGEVDDVDFVETSEGGYYLVEIEIDVEDGPDQATYQIHAISGKIMSVTWDD